MTDKVGIMGNYQLQKKDEWVSILECVKGGMDRRRVRQ